MRGRDGPLARPTRPLTDSCVSGSRDTFAAHFPKGSNVQSDVSHQLSGRKCYLVNYGA